MRALALMLGIGIGLAGLAAASSNTAPCGGTCFRAARGEARECRSSATGAFLLDRTLCLERNPVCVRACLEDAQECREATGIVTALDACRTELQQALTRCFTKHPTQSSKRAKCVDNAQLDAYQCRTGARRVVASELVRCKDEGDVCARGCGPGEPPLGADVCIDEAELARREALATCRRTFQTSGSACLGKADACVQQCREERDLCEAPVDDAFGAAVTACLQTHDAAVAACHAANPEGSAALSSCLETAGADAFTCRLAARDAAAPGLQACSSGYEACVRECPDATTP